MHWSGSSIGCSAATSAVVATQVRGLGAVKGATASGESSTSRSVRWCSSSKRAPTRGSSRPESKQRQPTLARVVRIASMLTGVAAARRVRSAEAAGEAGSGRGMVSPSLRARCCRCRRRAISPTMPTAPRAAKPRNQVFVERASWTSASRSARASASWPVPSGDGVGSAVSGTGAASAGEAVGWVVGCATAAGVVVGPEGWGEATAPAGDVGAATVVVSLGSRRTQPGSNEAGVDQARAVGLGDALVEVGDLGVARAVTERGLGDVPEGVAGLDDDGGFLGRRSAGRGDRCVGVGGVGGQQEDPAGLEPVGVAELAAVGLGAAEVEVADLGVAQRVAEVAGGDVPQGVPALHGHCRQRRCP